MRLSGKVALITGGAQGIGKATADLFISEGAHLVLGDVDERLVKAAADSINSEYVGSPTVPPTAMGVKNDVTSFESCEQIVQAAMTRFGRIDIVVNSAGITRDGLLIRMSEADWDLVMDVNLKGAFNLTKAVSRVMMKQRKGTIINIASVVGQTGNAGQANYSASKGGLIAFTKTCAKEFASRNMRVNAIAPGFIKTRLTDVLPEEVKQKALEGVPMGRIGQPEEVAKVLLFLASDDSSYMTGQVLGVNGGMYL